MSEYKKDLIYELRQRGLGEASIADIVRELPDDTADRLNHEFGSPREYAESFARGARRSAGWFIITAAVVIAVLAILGRVLAVVMNLAEQSVGVSIAILLGALALVGLAAIIAAMVDRRGMDSR